MKKNRITLSYIIPKTHIKMHFISNPSEKRKKTSNNDTRERIILKGNVYS